MLRKLPLALAVGLVVTLAGTLLSPRSDLTGATTGNSISTPDTDGGLFSSVALDANGNPVISYLDSANQHLKVLHCGDPNCTSGNSIASPDAWGSGFGGFLVRQNDTSLALDAGGNPVVSYVADWITPCGPFGRVCGAEELRVLHCGDSDCTSGNSIATIGGGWSPSLKLDAAGNPVVSFTAYNELYLLHCGDPGCTSGNSMVAADSEGAADFPSLALDASGNPVVSYSYWDSQTVHLRVLHCGDPNCTSGNSITAPDMEEGGGHTSLALDAGGNPVVTYQSGSHGLKVLHCGDPNCTSGNSITSPDEGPPATGLAPSLALDASGNPVVAYYESQWPDVTLKVLHCGNPNCTSGNSITSADIVGPFGDFTSLALDAGGNPVVSYFDDANVDLKVLHCVDPNCTGEAPEPTDTPTPTDTNTPTPTNTPSPTPTSTPTPTPGPAAMQKDVDPSTPGVDSLGNLWLCVGATCTHNGEGELVIAERVFNVNDPDGLGSYEFQLKFDHSIFDIVIEDAGFLGSTGRTVDCTMTIIGENDIRFGCVSSVPSPARRAAACSPSYT